MEIKVETCYGNVTLRSCYDCDSSSYFYDVYDENDQHLGELLYRSYFDEDDDESVEYIKIAVETAIECNDICTPSVKDDEEPLVYLITFLEYNKGCVVAESFAYDSMEKCMEAKLARINTFLETCDEANKKYEVNDADVICEIMTEDKSKYLFVTMKATTVM